jgi:Tol biopolymer transport system component
MVFTRAGGAYADDTPFVSRLDGSQERQIGPPDTCCVRLSPDGSSVLGSVVRNDGRITTGVFPLAGTDSRTLPLPPGTLNLGPGAWTPDGKQIVVQGWDDTHPAAAGMYLVDSSDGSHPTRLTREPMHTNDVPGDISPDGTLLAFVREDQPGDDSTSVGALALVDLANPGDVQTLVPSSSKVGLAVRFSPDGSRILFQDGRTSQRGAVWTIRPDGSQLTKVFDDADLYASDATWSPDGRQILFALNPVADYYSHPPNAFYVMNADGTGVRQLLDDGTFKREAEWFLPGRP